MDEIKYEKIGEVNGRWKAEIVESFLVSEGIVVELIQDAITHYIYKSAFDRVEIYVLKAEVNKARELLNSFGEFNLEEDGDEEE